MNARFRHLRIATLCSIFLALTFAGVLAALSPQESIAQRGNTATALAINEALNAPKSPATPKTAPRYPYLVDNAAPFNALHAAATANAAVPAGVVSLSEAVRTFDVFAPPPTFQPVDGPGSLTPTNLTPVWTKDELHMLFSSNRGDGSHFHIWMVDAGGGTPVQITQSNGNEFFPVLGAANDKLAFTSDAQTPGIQNLYVATQFNSTSPAVINVNSLQSPTINRNIQTTGFTQVGRPAFSTDEARVAFSALTSTGPDRNHTHIYFLYLSSNGYLQSSSAPNNYPGKLTAGLEDDQDVAWSSDGRYLLFTSNSTGFTNTGSTFLPDPVTPANQTTPVSSSNSTSTARLFIIQGDAGTVPTSLSGVGGAMTSGPNDGGGAWSDDASLKPGFIAFHRAVANTNATGVHTEIFFWAAESTDGLGTLTTFANSPQTSHLNTDNTNNSNDLYPAWPRLKLHDALTYQSNRSVTYNDVNNGNAPLETALTLAPGTAGVGVNYSGLLESAVDFINPPKLIPFTGSEIVHINTGSSYVPPSGTNPSGSATRDLAPSGTATFTVRLSDRESGLDDDNVYLQFKDPDSKFQDTRNDGTQIEHKIFTSGNTNDLNNDFGHQLNMEILETGGAGGAFVTDANGTHGIPGAVGLAFDGNNFLGIGHVNVDATGNGGDNLAGPTKLPGYDPAQFTNWGQEYECQFVNAHFADGQPTKTDPAAGDYGTPFFLAGFDDQNPNSAPAHRPEWLKLTRLPDSQQDKNGGILYSGAWKLPASPSDYYLDVIAYDQSSNWRIFDNIWGFNSQPFSGHHGILVVSDYALGQKFIGSTVGFTGVSNTLPTFYGTESYYTDIDPTLLPNAAVVWGALKGYPKVTETTIARGTGNMPNGLTFYTSFESGDSLPDIVLNWGPPAQNPPSYTIVRATDNGPTVTLTSVVPGTSTRFVDRAILGGDPKSGTQYTYFVVPNVNNPAPASVVVKMPDVTDLKTNGEMVVPLGGPIQPLNANNQNDTLMDQPRSFPAAKNGLGESSFGSIPVGRGANGSLLYFEAPELWYQADSTAIENQKYDIWRILSRGPIDSGTLDSYQSTPVGTEPAVKDGGINDPASSNFRDAEKCVIWISPYAGEMIAGAGTIADPATQATLTDFVNKNGGRLFISGGHVASALTNFGSQASPFLANILGATYNTQIPNPQVLTPGGARGNRLTFDPFFNQNQGIGVVTDYNIYTTGNPAYVYSPPSAHPTIMANSAGNILNAGIRANWRNDGSLDEFGPIFEEFNGDRTVEGFVDSVTQNTAITTNIHNDITYAGSAGLIYQELPLGGKVIFAPFGLESIGIEYYKVTNGGQDFYLPYNMRPNLLHNVVTYLRSGTFSGTITATNSQNKTLENVAGAIVYLTANDGVAIPGLPAGRTVYSAKTGNDGNYTIPGVEPGAYVVHAYANGYGGAQSNDSITVDALGSRQVSLTLTVPNPGTISGTVTFTDGQPANGVAVNFTDGSGNAFSSTTNTQGVYSISVPASVAGVSYTGFAQKSNVTAGPDTVIVTTQANATANFTLPPIPTFITGTITDSVTHAPLSGAVVAFTPSNGSTVIGTATTNASGVYTSPILPGGDYDLTATLTPDYLIGSASAVHVQEGDTVTQDFALQKAATGSLTGTATYTDGRVVAGAQITFTPTAGGAALTATTDSNGQYTITPVPSGTEPGKTYTGTAVKGHSSKTVTVTVPSGQAVTQNFSMPIPPGNFFGNVVDSDTNTPLVGVTVTFTPTSGAATTVTTDSNGHYDTGNLVAGSYTIDASFPPNYLPRTIGPVTLAEDATVQESFGLKKVTGGRITGVVASPAGYPVPGATVTFVTSGGTPLTATTSATGAYLISNLPTVVDPGLSYTGTATKGSATSETETVQVTNAAVIRQDFTLEPPTGTFAGTVTDTANGNPLVGATVVFTPLFGANRTASSAVTDANGQYQVPSLLFGQYQASASLSPKYLPQTINNVFLPDSVTTTQNFQLSKAANGTIGGLVAIEGVDFDGATVTITPDDGSAVITTTTNGSSSTGGDSKAINYQASVSPGGYTVTLSKAGYTSTSSVQVTVTSNGFQRADLAFTPIATIPTGTRMISAPYDYAGTTLDALLGIGKPAGSVRIAIWQPALLNYVLNPTAPADTLHLGYGYWIKLTTPSNIYFQGTAPSATTVPIQLQKYWNQIGVPSTSAINVSDLKFIAPNGSTLTFAQASAPDVNIVDKSLYSYDNGSNTYQPVTAGGTLSPWQGYWIKVYQNTTVLIPTNETATVSSIRRSSVSRK